MPPYTRETATSSRACEKLRKEREGAPMSTCVESTNAVVSPSNPMSTSAAAPDNAECPEGYSGNGGVEKNVVHFGLNTRCTYVTGRTTSERYFSFQHPTNASAIATDVRAYASTA